MASQMRACPVCRQSMHTRNLSAGGAKADVHECRRDGLWFDGGQLEKVVSRPVFELNLLQQATPPRRCPRCGHLHDHPAPVCDLCGTQIGLTCVSCHARLSRLDVGGVNLEICPSCGGIWLERHGFELLSGSSASCSRDATCARCSTALPASAAYYSEAGPVCETCRQSEDYAAWHAGRRAAYLAQLQERASASGGSRTLRGALLELVSARPKKEA